MPEFYNKKVPEVLSPAGNMDSLIAAVENCADAVYLGGKSFSARKNAVNFSDDELKEAVNYAHLRGCKVYVTLNTLISEKELKSAFDFINFCYNINVDALIVQDLGILSMIKEHFPDFRVHASTQMTIYNQKGAKIARDMGFSRVVLAREISKEEIKNISENEDIETEVFVHGALCVSYSGQCLMSSMIGARSGNRGDCAQPCRLPYSFLDKNGNLICDKKYILNMKDLCLINELKTLSDIGVTSFKIEGRMKSDSYTALCSALFSKYKLNDNIDAKDIENLQNIFSRNGFTNGYFENNTGRHMTNFDKSNDDIYKNVDKNLISNIKQTCRPNTKKIPVSCKCSISIGSPMKLVLRDNIGNEAEVCGTEIAQKAITSPVGEDRILSQLSKLGSTPYALEKWEITCQKGLIIPISEINSLRRAAVEKLSQMRIQSQRKIKNVEYSCPKSSDRDTIITKFSARVTNFEQAMALDETDISLIYVPCRVYDEHKDFFANQKDRYIPLMPPVTRDIVDFAKCDYDRVCVSNISQIETFRQKEMFGEYNLNVFNSKAANMYKNLGIKRITMSPEMTMTDIKDTISFLDNTLQTEVICYGYLPVMNVQNCVIKTAAGKCICDKSEYFMLRDRLGKDFVVLPQKGECISTVLNSAPLCMSDKMSALRGLFADYLKFIFTIETPEQIKHILKLFKAGKKPDFEFTRGHFFRGV